MASTGKNNKDTSSYMNNRIPRKKTASSLINGAKSTTGIQSDSASTNENQSTAVADILALPIPRKGKDDKQPNNKKRTHDMSTSIATTKAEKVKTTATPQDNNNNNTSLPINDNNVPTYQIVKEGRVSGYPIIVSQVGSEHDAILLRCKATDNPQDYLDNNKDGKVKIRWKFAGYNGLVPTHTVRLKVADFTSLPTRRAAALSGLSERLTKRNRYMGSTPVDNVEGSAPIESGSDVATECSLTLEPRTDETDTNAHMENEVIKFHNPTPLLVASQLGIKLEGDITSVATDPMIPLAAPSDMNIKTEGEETDDDELKPMAVPSNINIKMEGEEDTDDKFEIQPVASSSEVKMEGEAAYKCDTDDDEPRPLVVKSDMNVKAEVDTDNEVDTDDELETQPVTSDTKIKMEKDAAYGYDTDKDCDESNPMEMNVKTGDNNTIRYRKKLYLCQKRG